MPYDLPLPRRLQKLWKIKIQDKEPHVTIWRKGQRWRYGLRSRDFLDPKPDPGEVPEEATELIDRNYQELRQQWDARFPRNPVAPENDDDGN